jgi:myo-inositol-1(or 4)-monophosphatase
MSYKKELELLNNHVHQIYEEAIKKTVKTELKGTQDIVTSTDLAIEKAIVTLIQSAFPNDHFHTEEYYNQTKLKNRTWVIDPIDGTSNYAAQMGLFVVQIALFDQEDIVLSYVYIPTFNETYFAIKGEGAYLNGKKYRASDNPHKNNFMMAVVGLTQKNNDKTYYQKLIEWSQKHHYKLRMLGSIGLEMCFASKGVYDLFYSDVTNIWDIYPGILLNREAGAILCNELGEPYRLNKDVHLFVLKDESAKEKVFKGIK